MADPEQLIRARALYRGEDPEAAVAAYGQHAALTPPVPAAPAPTATAPVPAAPVPATIAPSATVVEASQADLPEIAPYDPRLSYRDQTAQVANEMTAAANESRAALGQRSAALARSVSELNDADRRRGEEIVGGDAAVKDLKVRRDAEEDAIRKKIAEADADIAKVTIGDKRTTGQRTMGVIGTALAGIGDALSAMGGRQTNFAAEVSRGIEAQVERDISLQRQRLEDKKGARAELMTELSVARQHFKDDMDAELYAQNVRRQRYADELERIAARTTNEERQGQLLEAAANVRADRAKGMQSLYDRQEEARRRSTAGARKSQSIDWGKVPGDQLEALYQAGKLPPEAASALSAYRKLGTSGEPKDSPDLAYRKQRDAEAQASQLSQREIVGLRNIKPLESISDNDKKQAQAAAVAYGRILSNLEEMKKIATTDWGPTAQDRFKLLQQMTVAMATQAAGSGVPGATEAVEYARGLPGPNLMTTWSVSDRSAIYDSNAANFANLRNQALQTYGYEYAGGGKPAGGNKTSGPPPDDSDLGIRFEGGGGL